MKSVFQDTTQNAPSSAKETFGSFFVSAHQYISQTSLTMLYPNPKRRTNLRQLNICVKKTKTKTKPAPN